MLSSCGSQRSELGSRESRLFLARRQAVANLLLLLVTAYQWGGTYRSVSGTFCANNLYFGLRTFGWAGLL